MRNTILKIVLLLLFFAAAVTLVAGDDGLAKIKAAYSDAAMVKLNVKIIIFSQIFGDADTTMGEIVLANDGRYYAAINQDLYLFDGKCNWEYSNENAQVTRQCLKEGEIAENRLFFIKDLDRYYASLVIKNNAEYKLTKKEKAGESLPDSMFVYLNKSRITSIEYYDLNNDLNQIYLINDSLFDDIADSLFEVNFPDSVEIITVP